MVIDIGPGLQALLTSAVPAIVTAIVTVVTLWIKTSHDAKAATDERAQNKAAQDTKLATIGSAVDGHATIAAAKIDDLKSALADALHAQGPVEQAAADKAGQKTLEKP